mmetsp:Transcript_42262/g.67666  ORF Transcript_42262/g.67666 Transcript_42262/m.67666 type:complete len:437 (+) Transcript_42262:202-1512(+)
MVCWVVLVFALGAFGTGFGEAKLFQQAKIVALDSSPGTTDYFGISIKTSGNCAIATSQANKVWPVDNKYYKYFLHIWHHNKPLDQHYFPWLRLPAPYEFSISGCTVAILRPDSDFSFTEYNQASEEFVTIKVTQGEFLGSGHDRVLFTSIAVAKDLIALGAPYVEDIGLHNVGNVYILKRNEAGDWKYASVVPPPFERAVEYLQFGMKVAFSEDGTTLVTNSRKGLFIYRRDGEKTFKNEAFFRWGGSYIGVGRAVFNEQVLDGNILYERTSHGIWTRTRFPISTTAKSALSRDAIYVANHKADTNGFNNNGAVYAYRRTSNGWDTEPTTVLTEIEPRHGEYFGTQLAVDEEGDTLLISSAYNYVRSRRGHVFVFKAPPQPWNWVCHCDLTTKPYLNCLEECRYARGAWNWSCNNQIAIDWESDQIQTLKQECNTN